MDGIDHRAETADALRRAFLDRLLRGLDRGTRRLRARLDRGGAEGSGHIEQRRLGWGWAVANELAGEGAAPDRREVRGSAWLAACLGAPRLEPVTAWPRLTPERSDWRAAYGLVLVTACGLESHPGARARVARAPGAWDWVLQGVGGQPTAALAGELARCLGPEAALEASEDEWRLRIPCAWWARAPEPRP